MHTPEHVYSGGLAPPGRSEGHEKQSGTQSEMSSVLRPKAPRRQQGRRAEKGTPVLRQHFTTYEVPAAPEGETPGVCAPRLSPTRLPRLPRPVGTETSGALSGGPGGPPAHGWTTCSNPGRPLGSLALWPQSCIALQPLLFAFAASSRLFTKTCSKATNGPVPAALNTSF